MASPNPKPFVPVGLSNPQVIPPIANPIPLSMPAVNQPHTDLKTGMMTMAWQQWFQQAYQRMGGSASVNPRVTTQTLGDDFPYNSITNTSAVVQYLNTIPFAPTALMDFYISQLGTTTIIDSLTCQNNASTPGSIGVFIATQNTLPPTNYTVFPLPANSGVITLSQFANVQMGSASYMGIVCNASAGPLAQQQIRCILKGRTIS